ncbi:MAG: glycoside hydrolase family 127 protein, partial [Kiritimatiellaeota bacterium]|nr:glycoside hydrolase family 127 protein [Kiritimatiellota bacterium]
MILSAMAIGAHGQQPGDIMSGSSNRARFECVKPGAVRWTDGFMKGVWDRNAEQTIPYLWERYQSKELAGYFLNFEKLADGADTGYLNGGVSFVDGDFYKWLEAVCYLLAQDRKSEWDGIVDKIEEVLARCQERSRARYGPDFDGFLATHTQLSDGKPLSDRARGGEVYCMGHLMSLAAVHHRVTGKTNLLTIGKRAGDFLWRTAQKEPGKTWVYWDHAAIIGAVELYRETKDRKYFDLAQHIVDSKGAHNRQDKSFNWNIQDNGRFLNQTRAVGHAQRANY